jgi:hypothetical protein
MDVQHDARGFLAVLLEEPFDHVHDEFHGRVVVVEKKDTIEVRSLDDGTRFGDDQIAGIVAVAAL